MLCFGQTVNKMISESVNPDPEISRVVGDRILDIMGSEEESI